MELHRTIEAVLFYKNEPVKLKDLQKLLNVQEAQILDAISKLKESLEGHGISIVQAEDSVRLATSRETSDLIEKMIKEELSRDLGKAGLETLSIILYLGPISRSRIDYIRGVNSSFIVRNLLIRDLVSRKVDPNDKRGFVYEASINLLAHLGITQVSELPDFEEVKEKIQQFESTKSESENEDSVDNNQEENE